MITYYISFFFSEKLFVVLNNGDILKCSTKTNPMSIEKTWKIQNPRGECEMCTKVAIK